MKFKYLFLMVLFAFLLICSIHYAKAQGTSGIDTENYARGRFVEYNVTNPMFCTDGDVNTICTATAGLMAVDLPGFFKTNHIILRNSKTENLNLLFEISVATKFNRCNKSYYYTLCSTNISISNIGYVDINCSIPTNNTAYVIVKAFDNTTFTAMKTFSLSEIEFYGTKSEDLPIDDNTDVCTMYMFDGKLDPPPVLGENIALRKPVFGNGTTLININDGNKSTAGYLDYGGPYNRLYIDFGKIYTIQYLSFVHPTSDVGLTGLNTPFTVYVTSNWDQCSKDGDYSGYMCAANLIFTRPGQRISVKCKMIYGDVIAHRIIITQGYPGSKVIPPQLVLGEVEVYGIFFSDYDLINNLGCFSVPQFSSDPAPIYDNSTNIAKGKIVKGCGGDTANNLVDGSYSTYCQSNDNLWPHLIIDFGGVYNISLISIVAPNNSAVALQYLQSRFGVYFVKERPNRCDDSYGYPWTICKASVSFLGPASRINIACPLSSAHVTRVVFASTKPTNIIPMPPIVIAEVEIYGVAVGNYPNLVSFNDPPLGIILPNYIMEIRKLLWNNTQSIRIQKFAHSVIPDFSRNDIPIWWSGKYVVGMAVNIKLARIFVIAEQDFAITFLETSMYNDLRKSIFYWLTNNTNNHYCVVNLQFCIPGAIIIMEHYLNDNTTDPNQLIGYLENGRNTMIAVVGEGYNSGPNALKIMQHFGIEVSNKRPNVLFDFYATYNDTVYSDQFIPPVDTIKLATENFNYLQRGYLPLPDMFVQSAMNQRVFQSAEYIYYADLFMKRYKQYAYENGPCPQSPISFKNNADRYVLLNYMSVGVSQYSSTPELIQQAQYFPGDIANSKPVSARIVFTPRLAKEYLATGYYGKINTFVTWELKTEVAYNRFKFLIGCHTDNNGWKEIWLRWPRISVEVDMAATNGKLYMPFGGVIYVIALYGDNFTLSLSNVYEYPYFDLDNAQSITTWQSGKWNTNSVPYMDFTGDAWAFCVETKLFRSLSASHMRNITEFFMDRMHKIMYSWIGKDYKKEVTTRMSFDVQISVGSGHSGYPIMAYNNWQEPLLDLNSFVNGGHWGFCHELGHNLQNIKYLLSNQGEVTNNVFCLVYELYVLNQSSFTLGGPYRGSTPQDMENLVQWWNASYIYPNWAKLDLTFYSYLGAKLGPGAISQTWTRYEQNYSTMVDAYPDLNQIDRWIVTLSQVTLVNLVPYHMLFGVPFDRNVNKILSSLPCYLPDDVYTRQVQWKIDEILTQFPSGCLRNYTPPVEPLNDLHYGFFENRPAQIIPTTIVV